MERIKPVISIEQIHDDVVEKCTKVITEIIDKLVENNLNIIETMYILRKLISTFEELHQVKVGEILEIPKGERKNGI